MIAEFAVTYLQYITLCLQGAQCFLEISAQQCLKTEPLLLNECKTHKVCGQAHISSP